MGRSSGGKSINEFRRRGVGCSSGVIPGGDDQFEKRRKARPVEKIRFDVELPSGMFPSFSVASFGNIDRVVDLISPTCPKFFRHFDVSNLLQLPL